jgi:hypothetical protein
MEAENALARFVAGLLEQLRRPDEVREEERRRRLAGLLHGSPRLGRRRSALEAEPSVPGSEPIRDVSGNFHTRKPVSAMDRSFSRSRTDAPDFLSDAKDDGIRERKDL